MQRALRGHSGEKRIYGSDEEFVAFGLRWNSIGMGRMRTLQKWQMGPLSSDTPKQRCRTD
jgi:hypothetical protein